jgi:nucleotide-binding universal stress UspA family protein
MYSRILAPLDGSKFSECAVDHVAAMAKANPGSEVTLLTVAKEIDSPTIGEYVSQSEAVLISKTFMETNQQIRQNAEQYLMEKAAALGKQGVSARTITVQARSSEQVADKILDYAQKNAVDLIIMSTHGRSGISRWAMGSVADRIVQSSKAPVLTITPSGCRL